MHSVRIAACLVAFTLAAGLNPGTAEARCKVWTATHNGTDLFYPNEGGAAGTAANKLIWQVEQWKKEKGIKRVRIGKIRTSCGDWFMKYFLPHKHCIAKANVCY
jgi:hypothetical protein